MMLRTMLLSLVVASAACSDKRENKGTTMQTGAWAQDGLRRPIALARQHVVATARPIAPSPIIGAPRAKLSAVEAVAVSRVDGSVLWRKKGTPPPAFADDEGVVLYSRTGVAIRVAWEGHETWRTILHDDRSDAGRAREDADTPFEASVFRIGPRTVLASGAGLASVGPSGDQQTLTLCPSPRGIVLSAFPSLDGGAYALCGERSGYDDETEPWSGPMGHGEHPTYAAERPGGETLVRVDRNGDIAWRHAIPMGTSGWGGAANDELFVYVTPSGDASPPKAVGIRRDDGAVAWTVDLPRGPGDVHASQLGFLIRSQLIDPKGTPTWTEDVPMRGEAWGIDGTTGYVAGEREVLVVDLRTGQVLGRMPLDPVEGSPEVVGVASRVLIVTVATTRQTLVGIPLAVPPP